MNAATLRLLIEKGLSPADLIQVAEAMEVKRDNTAAERQARYRSKRKSNAVTVTPFPPIEELHTPVSPSLDKSNDRPPPDENLVSVWNERAKASDLPIARPLDVGRKAKARLRLKEFGEAGLHDAIRRIQASPFHCGKNDRDWRASLGWLLKSSENVAKALDLPEAPKSAEPVDLAEAADKTAALMRRMGRDEDAAEHQRRAEALRRGSTGPPRSIGQVLPRTATG